MTKKRKLSKLLNNIFSSASDSFSPLSMGNLAAWYKPSNINRDRTTDYESDYVFNAELKTSLILTDGTGDPTFARADSTSCATVWGYAADANAGADQVLLTCAANEARFTGARRVSEGVWSAFYADGTAISDSTLKGYLAEGARTNLCLQSADFATTWILGESTLSANAITAPDGTASADKLVESANNTEHTVYQTVTASLAAYTASVYAKAGERDWLYLRNTETTGKGVWFNLATGVVGTQDAGRVGAIESVGNGWYRCSVTATAAAGTWYMACNASTGDGVVNYAGDITKGIYLWGAQFELGSFASSYIPTTTAAVTRAADSLTYPTSGNLSATVGTCYAETIIGASGVDVAIVGDSSFNALPIFLQNSDGKFAISDSTTITPFGAAQTRPMSSAVKVAVSWGGSTQSGCVSGGTVGSGVFDGTMNISAIAIGSQTGITHSFGNIRNVRIWDKALPKYVLKTLTGGTGPSSDDLLVSVWEDASGNDRPLEQITAANQPINLPHTGSDYAYLPGVAGNYFSTPDSAANSITGDIDIRVKVALDDWTPGAANTLVAKYSAIGNLSYLAYVDTTGVLGLVFTSDGSNVIVAQSSSAAPVVSDGATLWVRITRASASGSVNYYTSIDGSSWTLLGSADRTSTAGGLFDGNAPIEIGTNLLGTTQPLLGKIYRTQIYNGIDGTLAVDFDPSRFIETSTNGTTATASTGEVWTLNSTGAYPATIVKSSQILGGGVDEFLQTAAFTLNNGFTDYIVCKPLTWTAGDVLASGLGAATAIAQVTGTPKIGLNAGAAVAENTNATLNGWHIVTAVFDGANSLLQVDNTTATIGDAGANNAGGLSLFSDNAGANWWNGIVKERVTFSAAHTAAQRALMQSWLNSRYGTF